MDEKPSPGPWTWEAEYDGRYRTYRLKSADPTANDIAFGFDDGLHCDNPADRALIAKAPTLSAELAEARATLAALRGEARDGTITMQLTQEQYDWLRTMEARKAELAEAVGLLRRYVDWIGPGPTTSKLEADVFAFLAKHWEDK